MANFDEDILTAHAARQRLRKSRALVVMKQILRDSCSLGLPVGPNAHRAVMDMVPAHDDINGRMHLDACDLRAAEFHHVVDMVDVVVFNNAEDAAHAPDDAALLTVMDVAAADDMTADLLLQPAMILSAADRVAFHLCGTLYVMHSEKVIIVRIIVLAE